MKTIAQTIGTEGRAADGLGGLGWKRSGDCSISMAKAYARSTACKNHLRQMGATLQMYVHDHEHRDPYGANPYDPSLDQVAGAANTRYWWRRHASSGHKADGRTRKCPERGLRELPGPSAALDHIRFRQPDQHLGILVRCHRAAAAQRFYRAWQMGTPSVAPSLGLNMVPALTLTGGIGGSVRVDYIHRFGPIDAWVTLATVTLTNTTQLYLDTSAPGQPDPLYRLTPVP